MKNFLVKATVAKDQLDIEPPVVEVEPEEIAPPAKVDDFVETPPPLPKYFSMDVVLDNIRYTKELNKYVEEVASHLMNIPRAETLTLPTAKAGGIPNSTTIAQCVLHGLQRRKFPCAPRYMKYKSFCRIR